MKGDVPLGDRCKTTVCQRLWGRSTILLLFVLLLTGCAFGEKKMGQAALKSFETRPLDAPFEEVYGAAVEAMFDLGYTVTHSDKGSGIVVGEKRKKKSGIWLWGDLPEGKHIEDYYDFVQLTLLVKKAGDKESKVRIKTAVNKEIQLDKEAVDEVWLYIQRQVMMEEKPEKKS